jgi:hypothetical protein
MLDRLHDRNVRERLVSASSPSFIHWEKEGDGKGPIFLGALVVLEKRSYVDAE